MKVTRDQGPGTWDQGPGTGSHGLRPAGQTHEVWTPKLDLYRLDLYGLDLYGLDLHRLDLYRLDLYRLDLHRLDLYRLDLYRLVLYRLRLAPHADPSRRPVLTVIFGMFFFPWYDMSAPVTGI
ncbi:hypothetical protein EYF80_056059 [Liparis tanakae]|uniref:Uncharacterized protein n=1 Tax=Liparis tanakae TaxID=230148 RepID=A0A4Z2EY51_9TELE|nr:hypothetical protein EYF80_056059 [Liparis tanakae]